MLDPKVQIVDINLEHWRRLTLPLDQARRARRLFLVHEGGKPVRLHDTEKGDLPLPGEAVSDPAAAAKKLFEQNEGLYEVQVVDPDAYGAAMAKARVDWSGADDVDDWLKKEWEQASAAAGLAVYPQRGFLWNGLPMGRYRKFIEKMLPDSCTYVLAAFEGERIWTSLVVGFENGKITHVTTFDALDAEDLEQVTGRDQHPFLLSMVTNAFKRPAFGWFCERETLDAYLSSGDEDSMDEIFQRALMEKSATFDFSVLVQNGVTPLGPINPGEAQQDSPRAADPEGADGPAEG